MKIGESDKGVETDSWTIAGAEILGLAAKGPPGLHSLRGRE
jgi:hypothetical protein